MTDDCHGNATCKNTIGSYTFSCLEGFKASGQDCSGNIFFNNSYFGRIALALFASPISFVPTPKSMSISFQMRLLGLALHIVLVHTSCFILILDIDECKENSDDCHGNATCKNTIGSFSCSCNEGFTGSGQNCTGNNKVFQQFLRRALLIR